MSASRAGSRRVLIVDDEPAVRRFASRVLLEEGFLVEEAMDGAEALARLITGGPAVHVVVSDVVMPGIDGVKLLQALHVLVPTLPVLLISAYATVQLDGLGIAAPCGILAKPFSGERLVEEVRRCLTDADPLAFSTADAG
ncbi:MAG: response regulator [Gemmatimonadales bacterium]|nr:response regulator [Gemmatimonadales bacterium]